jgi:hypothetical protein
LDLLPHPCVEGIGGGSSRLGRFIRPIPSLYGGFDETFQLIKPGGGVCRHIGKLAILAGDHVAHLEVAPFFESLFAGLANALRSVAACFAFTKQSPELVNGTFEIPGRPQVVIAGLVFKRGSPVLGLGSRDVGGFGSGVRSPERGEGGPRKLGSNLSKSLCSGTSSPGDEIRMRIKRHFVIGLVVLFFTPSPSFGQTNEQVISQVLDRLEGTRWPTSSAPCSNATFRQRESVKADWRFGGSPQG